MSRSVSELVHDLTELGADVRTHLIWHRQGDVPGLTKEEGELVVKKLTEMEKPLLDAAVAMHEIEGVMLNASVRWLAKEHQGQDPTKPETTH